ncbi:MAG TPA: PQQ-binding-like beta-propeller repeat protein [Polyangiaceae bacterium]|nr:PQQ-binding-like beta-propeller repeat protein [Polyangiaceae bacterium]
MKATRKATRSALIGCIALAGAACSSLRSGADPELPLWVHRASGSLQVTFKRNIVAESRRTGEPYERGQVEIDPAHGRIFVGSSDQGLYALRADDGQKLWRFETLGFVQCAPLYDAAEDVVYFGSNDGALYKVRAQNGALLWRFNSNAEVARRPVLEGGTLYVANANDTVMAIEPATGKLLWNQHRTPAAGMEVAGYAGVAVFHGKVYAGFSDGTVAAFDAKSGAERWQPVDLAAEAEQTLGQVPEQLDVDSTPIPDTLQAGAVVYASNYAAGVFALDAETGTQVWANLGIFGVTDITLFEQPAHRRRDGRLEPERRVLLAASGTTGLWGLDPETGTERWRRSLPATAVSHPVVVSGALLISASRLGLFLVSPLGGELIDGIHMADGSSMTPAAYGSRAYVMTNGGALLGLHVASPI